MTEDKTNYISNSCHFSLQTIRPNQRTERDIKYMPSEHREIGKKITMIYRSYFPPFLTL